MARAIFAPPAVVPSASCRQAKRLMDEGSLPKTVIARQLRMSRSTLYRLRDGVHVSQTRPSNEWRCPNCGVRIITKRCLVCGATRPVVIRPAASRPNHQPRPTMAKLLEDLERRAKDCEAKAKHFDEQADELRSLATTLRDAKTAAKRSVELAVPAKPAAKKAAPKPAAEAADVH